MSGTSDFFHSLVDSREPDPTLSREIESLSLDFTREDVVRIAETVKGGSFSEKGLAPPTEEDIYSLGLHAIIRHALQRDVAQKAVQCFLKLNEDRSFESLSTILRKPPPSGGGDRFNFLAEYAVKQL